MIVISGTSASGKSTVARKLIEMYDNYQIVRAITTRKKRDNDQPGDYKYVSRSTFEESDLVISTSYREALYGITNDDLTVVTSKNKVPILIITPESYWKTEIFRGGNQHISIFLDCEDDILNDRLKARSEANFELSPTLNERQKDRNFSRYFEYRLDSSSNYSLDQISAFINWLYLQVNHAGMLGEYHIRQYINWELLLTQTNDDNIQSASYDLRLGDEYYNGGKIKKLSERNPFILIEPYDYAIVTSYELANFPNSISGRFDLSISLFCQGVILSNGPQIDPGFSGRLFCLLFNTSNSAVVLKRRQHYATIEFNKLIGSTSGYRGKYLKKESIVDYLPSNTLQGGVHELKKELEKVRKESKSLQSYFLAIISLILAILSILLVLR